MAVTFANSTGVFLFIIFCSIYVCSILWIYGDAATRDMGNKGLILPFIFVIAGAMALVKGWFFALIIWPVAYVAWFFLRPKNAHAITE